jgi:hypothetical protein
MAKYLLLKHYRGAPNAINEVPMEQWTPERSRPTRRATPHHRLGRPARCLLTPLPDLLGTVRAARLERA